MNEQQLKSITVVLDKSIEMSRLITTEIEDTKYTIEVIKIKTVKILNLYNPLYYLLEFDIIRHISI